MAISSLAGKPAPSELLVDLARLERAYYDCRPDVGDPHQLVSFGTSGHRGSSLDGTFTEAHILAITQAICEYRSGQGTDGPLYMGKDTHALSAPGAAHRPGSAGGQRRRDHHPARRWRDPDARHLSRHSRAQPRPPGAAWRTASSSRHRTTRRRTAASNTTRPTAAPPTREVTKWIQDRANELLRGGNRDVQARAVLARPSRPRRLTQEDFVLPYVNDLRNVVDMDAIRAAGLKLAVDPLGGAAVHYWEPINAIYGLNIHVVNPKARSHLLVHDRRS